MATTGILRSRRSVAQLHALAGVEREIRANDNSSARKYVRDFRDAYRAYERVLNAGDVRGRIAESGIVLIGDYHALPTSQRFLASLIREAGLGGRPLALGVETIFARDQHIVDEWQHGEIDECELRQRIRFDLDWGYDWAPFLDVLSAAQEQGAPIYGLDCMPREDLRKIGARDRHAADKIVEMRRAHPDALIFVLFGESHLAPQHLPACLAERFDQDGVARDLPGRRVLTVLQNVDALYWRAAGEARDRVEAVEVSPAVLCVFNATPLEKYENYRLCLDRWGRGDDSGPDLGPTLYNLIDGLVRFLGINQYSPHNSTQPRLLVDLMPEVYSRNSDALLRRLLARKGFSAAQKREMLHQVSERGGAYVAPLNAFYVRKFDMTSATESAARFLHHACRGLPDRVNGKHHALRGGQDAFFAAVLEHALACFGSRILHPSRAPFRDADLEELHELTCEDLERQASLKYPHVVDVLDFLSWYRRSARGNSSRHAGVDWTRALAFTGRKWEYTTERLGCLLGNDLYDAYLEGRLGPPALRRLFLAHLEEPGAASEVYANLNARLR
ncbi:MAG: ChaN family lipoprotein [Terriglobales bacterium]